MPHETRWYIENEIIFVRYSGVMSKEELRGAMLELKDLIESSPRPLVHVINDSADVTVPVSIKDSVQLVREVGSHERIGWTLTVREKSLVLKMGTAFGTSIFKMRFRAFDTLEQALAHLRTVDSTIHWEQAKSEVVKDR